MEKTVYASGCVYVNDMAPLREQDTTGEDIVEKQPFLVAIRSMLPSLAPGQCWEQMHRDRCWGMGKQKKDISPQLSHPAPQHGRAGRWGTLPAFGSAKQDQASHHRTMGCSSATAPGNSWVTQRGSKEWGGFAWAAKLTCHALILCCYEQRLKSLHVRHQPKKKLCVGECSLCHSCQLLRFWLTAMQGTIAALTCCTGALPHCLSPHRWTSKPPAWAGSSSSWVILLPFMLTIGQKWAFLLVLFPSSFPCCFLGLNYSLPLTSRWSSNPGSAQPYLTLESKQNPVCLPQHSSHKFSSMALP